MPALPWSNRRRGSLRRQLSSRDGSASDSDRLTSLSESESLWTTQTGETSATFSSSADERGGSPSPTRSFLSYERSPALSNSALLPPVHEDDSEGPSALVFRARSSRPSARRSITSPSSASCPLPTAQAILLPPGSLHTLPGKPQRSHGPFRQGSHRSSSDGATPTSPRSPKAVDYNLSASGEETPPTLSTTAPAIASFFRPRPRHHRRSNPAIHTIMDSDAEEDAEEPLTITIGRGAANGKGRTSGTATPTTDLVRGKSAWDMSELCLDNEREAAYDASDPDEGGPKDHSERRGRSRRPRRISASATGFRTA